VVVLEKMHAEFKVFGEALGALNDKVTAGFAGFEQRFEQIDRRLDQMDGRLGRVEQALDLVKEVVLAHGRELKEIRAVMVRRDEVEAIVERVVARAAGS
jgi:hypothetical protein